MDNNTFDLSLEQQFEMQRVRTDAQSMSHDQVLESLLEVSRLIMLKDNLIRDLMRRSAS